MSSYSTSMGQGQHIPVTPAGSLVCGHNLGRWISLTPYWAVTSLSVCCLWTLHTRHVLVCPIVTGAACSSVFCECLVADFLSTPSPSDWQISGAALALLTGPSTRP